MKNNYLIEPASSLPKSHKIEFICITMHFKIDFVKYVVHDLAPKYLVYQSARLIITLSKKLQDRKIIKIHT